MAKKDGKKTERLKSDLDRLGVFQEMSYISIGDEYKNRSGDLFNSAASKGKQMLIGTTKAKSSTGDGYFDKKFSRAFDGEAPKKKSNDGVEKSSLVGGEKKKPFLPTGGAKKASGLGSYYGCISGPPEAMSSGLKTPPHKEHKNSKRAKPVEPKKTWNFCGNPGSTFTKYYEHMADDYDAFKVRQKEEILKHKGMMKGGAFRINLATKGYFEENPYKTDGTQPRPAVKVEPSFVQEFPFKPSSPAKWDGGMKAGCLNPYPSSEGLGRGSSENVERNPIKNQAKFKVFHTSAAQKSTPVVSLLALNVDRSINSQNFKTLLSLKS